jgi:hypothetical protein
MLLPSSFYQLAQAAAAAALYYHRRYEPRASCTTAKKMGRISFNKMNDESWLFKIKTEICIKMRISQLLLGHSQRVTVPVASTFDMRARIEGF